jgi:hypothetical protein
MNGCLINVDHTYFFAITMRLLAQIIEPLPKSLNLKGDSKRFSTPIWIKSSDPRIWLQNIIKFWLQTFVCVYISIFEEKYKEKQGNTPPLYSGKIDQN